MLEQLKARTAGATSRRAVRRGVVLLVVTLLLHVVMVDWATGVIGVPFLQDRQQRAIVVELHKPAPEVPATPNVPKPAVVPQPQPVKHARKPAVQHKRRLVSASESAPLAPMPPEPMPPEPMTAGAEVADTTAPNEADVQAAGPPSEPVAAVNPVPEPAKPVDQPVYRFDAPPSAELKYDVQALREGQKVYGNGTINWVSNGSTYSVHGEAGVLFFTLLSFDSSGQIDDNGVGPVLYSEKRFRRAETNTHFQRERNTISFSSSTVTYPRQGGEQDRASVVWQLAALGRGDSSKFAPGAELEFFVAGVRDGEPWRMRIIGREDIDLGGDKINAWHVVRLPKPGSYDQKIDIWFAPQRQWYPVKIRYTETNGEYLDMALSAAHPVESR